MIYEPAAGKRKGKRLQPRPELHASLSSYKANFNILILQTGRPKSSEIKFAHDWTAEKVPTQFVSYSVSLAING